MTVSSDSPTFPNMPLLIAALSQQHPLPQRNVTVPALTLDGVAQAGPKTAGSTGQWHAER